MKKTMNVPFTSVSADPEIQRMREMLTSGEELVIDSDGTIGKAHDFEDDKIGGSTKAKTVPKGIVSVPEQRRTTVQEIIDEMRGEADENDITSLPENKSDTKKGKTSIVPKGIVSVKGICEMNEEADLQDFEGSDECYTGNEPAPGKTKLVPKTAVSAGQWYERDPELLEAEKAAMYDYQGRNAKFGIMKDGRAYWRVHCQPSIAGKDKRSCRAYDIALVYDPDHPKKRYGSSVKAYFLSPSMQDLQEIVNRTPSVSPKSIPHVLMDEKGELYPCSVDTANVHADIDSSEGVTSASTSLRFALRWINIFELGLIDPATWALFQKHGAI